jgi:hypothetical protein
MERVSEGGDHHIAMVFFQGVRVFDRTSFARTLTHQKAFELIVIGKLKLKHYPIMRHPSMVL